MEKEPKFRNIIFDIDGTLIDTEQTGVLSLIQTVKELMGRDMSYEEGYSSFGIPSIKVGALLGYADTERFAHVWEEHFIELEHLMKAFPGVEDMLAKLSGAGCRIGCVTSRNRFEFDKDVELKPLRQYFELEICAEDTLRHKPDPEPALEFLRRSRAEAADTIFIGDTMHDFQCASGAGLKFMLADWRSRGLQSIPADYLAHDAGEMLAQLL